MCEIVCIAQVTSTHPLSTMHTQAQCLLNLSCDAVLLQTEQSNCHHCDPVDAGGGSPDQAFSEGNLLPVPDPVKQVIQSESLAPSSQVTTPSAPEQRPKTDAKSVSSKLPRVLQRKKHGETEI